MSTGFRQFFKGLRIKPKTTSTVGSLGDLDVDSTNNKINFHNGTTSSPIVTQSHTATLTNKTIDADQNTITNIENVDIKALAGIDAPKIADGSISNAEFQQLNGVTSSVVGISDTQTLTNKTINADNNTITNIDNNEIKALAAIDATKIANGSVSNTEFQYLDGVTSAIQTQLDSKTTGPGSSTDNAVARYNGTAGAIQNSGVTISDTNDVIIPGDLTVNGTSTFINTTSLEVADPNIILNNGGNDASSEGAGITIERTGTNGSLVYQNSLASKFKAGALGSEIELVNVSGTQTLTNKTLSGNTATNLVSGAGTLTLNTSGTITTPNATDTLVARNTTDTLTNKTLTSPQLNTPRTDVITFDGQASAPSNPSAGDYKIYVKDATGSPYILDSAGNETEIGTGSGSGINYIENPDAEIGTTGWATYSDQFTIAPADVNAGADTISNVGFGTIGFQNGTRVTFTSSGTLPGGISAATQYILTVSGSPPFTTFQLYSTSGTLVDITSQGTGTHTCYPATPFNGSGGTANVTFTQTLTSPLRETASFLLTKDANNRQGEGASYAFTIDNADKSKVLQISLDYIINSGTYSGGTSTTNSDLIVSIFDATNGTIIQPSGFKLDSNSSTVSGTLTGTFQTASNSTSYYLIVHVGTESTSGYSVKMDNVRVGPQVTTIGYAGADWVSFIPTGSMTTNTTYSGRYRRLGSDMELQYKVTWAGAPNAVTLTVNLPTGHTVDETTLLDNNNGVIQKAACGIGDLLDGGVAEYQVITEYSFGNNNFEPRITTGSGTSSYANISSTSPFTIASGDALQFTAKVPIQGWSSNVQVSSDTDTRVVAFRASRSATQSIPNVTATAVVWDTLTYDTHGSYNISNGRYTAPVPGYYKVSVMIENPAASTDSQAYIYKNGTVYANLYQTNNTEMQYETGTDTVQLNSGDYIEVRAYQNTGGNANIATNGASYTHVTIERLSGPSQIAASDIITARYTTDAAQSIPNNTSTIINFEDKTFDTHSSVTTGATWKFTAQISGYYDIATRVMFASTTAWALSEAVNLYIFKNGIQYSRICFNTDHDTSGTSNFIDAQGTDLVQLNSGEYIDVRVIQNSGGALALHNTSDDNIVTIKRLTT